MFSYKSSGWRKKRAYILKRDGYLCCECRRYGRNRDADTVHHIVPVSEDRSLAYANENLQSLCAGCHNKKHPEKSGKRGYPPL